MGLVNSIRIAQIIELLEEIGEEPIIAKIDLPDKYKHNIAITIKAVKQKEGK